MCLALIRFLYHFEIPTSFVNMVVVWPFGGVRVRRSAAREKRDPRKRILRVSCTLHLVQVQKHELFFERCGWWWLGSRCQSQVWHARSYASIYENIHCTACQKRWESVENVEGGGETGGRWVLKWLGLFRGSDSALPYLVLPHPIYFSLDFPCSAVYIPRRTGAQARGSVCC